jgi:perosamine synthetase
MIPYGHQFIDNSDIEAVTKTLRSDWLTQGPKIIAFEKKLAEISGVQYAVAVANGTAALHLAYLAAGLKKGDEVVTTPNTFVATTNMLIAVGAKPVFCDIRLDTYNIDEEKIEELITPRTRAIAPVHFAGTFCDMDKILSLARKHKILVIADACHALGGSYKNKPVGSLGDISVLSFHPVKSITTGEGGAILTNNKDFADKARLLRSHGVVKDKNGFNVMKEFGYNYRICDIQASLGLSQLTKLNKFIAARNKIFLWYEKYLKDVESVILPVRPDYGRSAGHLYVIRVAEPALRLPLYNFLRKKGVLVNFHYPPVYSHPYYKELKISGNCPSADLYGQTAITLPIYVGLGEKQVKNVCELIRKFLEENEKER